MKIKKINELNESNETIDDLFIALDGKNQLIVFKHQFDDTRKLISLLNSVGFNLGTGHDEIEKEYDDKGFKLILTPYVGHSPQFVRFMPLSEYLNKK
jgi:vacuolar-type H+-ATPase subunit I/STV1